MYFELGDKVEIVDTYAEGTIVGKAAYLNGTTSYFVRFVDPAGNLVKQWFEPEDLNDVDEEEFEPIETIDYDDDSDDDDSDDDDSDDDDSDDDDVDYDYGWK